MKTQLKFAFSALLVVGSLVMSGCGSKDSEVDIARRKVERALPYVDINRQDIDMENCKVEPFNLPDGVPVIGQGYQIGELDGYLNGGEKRSDLTVVKVLKEQGVVVQIGSGPLRFFVETDELYVDNMALHDSVYVFVGTATLHTREGDPIELMAFAKMADKYLNAYRESKKQERLKAEQDRKAEEARLEQMRKDLESTFNLVDIPGCDYKMGKTEVTQDQWMSVVSDNPSRFKGGDRPVERVSWIDAQAFIKILNERDDVKAVKVKFRLPTAEEWEHACRAGGTGDWGKRTNGAEGPLDVMGWYIANSGDETHPVAQKEPNAWGLYDMHGNVYEWTATVLLRGRVIAGGSWINTSGDCEAKHVDLKFPTEKSETIGFRLIMESL